MQRDETGKWVCVDCANDFIREVLQSKIDAAAKSEGGIELPEGVRDERMTITTRYQDSIPNRAARRRLRKHG